MHTTYPLYEIEQARLTKESLIRKFEEMGFMLFSMDYYIQKDMVVKERENPYDIYETEEGLTNPKF